MFVANGQNCKVGPLALEASGKGQKTRESGGTLRTFYVASYARFLLKHLKRMNITILVYKNP